MKHSNQIREFVITDHGIELEDVYVGPEGVLTGSLRASQEAREKAAALLREQEMHRRAADLERRRSALQAQILALQHEVKAMEQESHVYRVQYEAETSTLEQQREEAAVRRGGDAIER